MWTFCGLPSSTFDCLFLTSLKWTRTPLASSHLDLAWDWQFVWQARLFCYSLSEHRQPHREQDIFMIKSQDHVAWFLKTPNCVIKKYTEIFAFYMKSSFAFAGFSSTAKWVHNTNLVAEKVFFYSFSYIRRFMFFWDQLWLVLYVKPCLFFTASAKNSYNWAETRTNNWKLLTVVWKRDVYRAEMCVCVCLLWAKPPRPDTQQREKDRVRI